MPTTQPRISTVVEKPLYEAIRRLARQDEVSISDKARSLLREALETLEDMALDTLVEHRRAVPQRRYTLAEIKKRYRIR